MSVSFCTVLVFCLMTYTCVAYGSRYSASDPSSRCRMEKTRRIVATSGHRADARFRVRALRSTSRNRTNTVIPLIDEGEKNSQRVAAHFALFSLSRHSSPFPSELRFVKSWRPTQKNSSLSVVIWSFEGSGPACPIESMRLSVMDGCRLGLGAACRVEVSTRVDVLMVRSSSLFEV